jgi:hypothetical protein
MYILLEKKKKKNRKGGRCLLLSLLEDPPLNLIFLGTYKIVNYDSCSTIMRQVNNIVFL